MHLGRATDFRGFHEKVPDPLNRLLQATTAAINRTVLADLTYNAFEPDPAEMYAELGLAGMYASLLLRPFLQSPPTLMLLVLKTNVLSLHRSGDCSRLFQALLQDMKFLYLRW